MRGSCRPLGLGPQQNQGMAVTMLIASPRIASPRIARNHETGQPASQPKGRRSRRSLDHKDRTVQRPRNLSFTPNVTAPNPDTHCVDPERVAPASVSNSTNPKGIFRVPRRETYGSWYRLGRTGRTLASSRPDLRSRKRQRPLNSKEQSHMAHHPHRTAW